MTWTMKMKPYAKWIVALVFTCAVLMQAICIAKADEPKADTMAPALQAEIKENKLQIKVTDDHSGVAGVQVNGMLFTTMQDEILTIDLTDVLGKYEHLSIRAFDYAGNFCEPVKLDNPCFEVVATPTIVPTNTPKPTKNPVKDDVSVDSTTTPRITTAPTLKPFGNSVVYVNDWATNTVQPQPVATATPAVEYITLGPGMPFQSEGNGHTLDMLYSAATNKQFISMQTKSGNTFYLVIDYDKPIDEDAELYETYFLNLVDERDLLDLISDDDKQELPTPTPQIVYVTPAPTKAPVATPVPDTSTEQKPAQSTAILALLGILALGGGGAYLFMKQKNGTGRPKADNDFDMDDDEDDAEDGSEA